MLGSSIFGALGLKVGLTGQGEIADYLGLAASRISTLSGQNLSERTIATLLINARSAGAKGLVQSIQPIVEFYPVSECEKSSRSIIDQSDEGNARLRRVLESATGLYTFYNSEYEIIYVGKARKQDLWSEILQAYNSEKSQYERYAVRHPRGTYRPSVSGSVRKIAREMITLRGATTFFSAYSIADELIDVLETLLIRLTPNDLLNVRMEGNTTLEMYTED
ncbi:MAG TPA: hypothetical protein EYG02_10470 [Henriciella marina]|uniref:hypothetical protein n=1 Tax=Henriciella sp. TaxID=1968823 RepID=UPI0017BB329E|nr:hypothetical protein [Henriciella sp.]HIG21380.1 hypothetical protein [Henriciella sp.]HIK65436.1 hypothetical protein [Henriciella marina]